MTCRDLVEFLTEFLSGELPTQQRRTFEQHLAECAACVAYLKSYQDATRLSRAAFAHPDDPVPDDVPEELLQAVLAARTNQKRRP